MKSSLRWMVVAALGLAFMAGRASSHQGGQASARSSCEPASEATTASAPAPRPWAVQGFRGADCQVLGDIPECD
jgi:hypothetical protein